MRIWNPDEQTPLAPDFREHWPPPAGSVSPAIPMEWDGERWGQLWRRVEDEDGRGLTINEGEGIEVRVKDGVIAFRGTFDGGLTNGWYTITVSDFLTALGLDT